MLAVVGAAAVVLLAGAPWVLPSAAGEPRGLGEGRATGKENWVRVTAVPARSPRREQAPLSILRTLTWSRASGWLVGGRPDSSRNALPSLVPFVWG